jgi:MFS family permease
VASVVATRAAGPAARALGLVGAGGMLANVVGVPLGAFAGQLADWRDHDRRRAVGLLLHLPAADRRGRLTTGLVPLVIVGSLLGTVLGGRVGDVRPHATAIVVPAVTTVAADELLGRDPLALLLRMMLDQHMRQRSSGTPRG